MLASHDIRFVDEVLGTDGQGAGTGAKGTAEVWVVGKGGVKKWTKGGVTEYVQARLEKIQKQMQQQAAAASRRASGS